MSIYLAKRCETLKEFKRHKFSTLLGLGKYEEYDEAECLEIENGFFGRETLTDCNGKVYENWRTYVLKNLDDGTQVQIDCHDDKEHPIQQDIEIFNTDGKLIFSTHLNRDNIFYNYPNSMFIRPSGIGEGEHYFMDENYKIVATQTGGGVDIHDFDPDFLNKMEEIREATYMPIMRGGREKYKEK